MARLFAVDDEALHHVGDPACPACSEGYPDPCRCGGLMHGAVTEDTHAGTAWVTTRCDQCGLSEEDVDEELGRKPGA